MELETKVDRVVAAIGDLDTSDARLLVAIAGPPGSGKSTLAEHVQKRLQENGTPCGLVPMDGFHLDNDVLRARGLYSKKGAPQTFDAEGFHALVERLCSEDTVQYPLFDRENDRVSLDAATITYKERIVLVEGNYLFLDDPAWRPLSKFWALKVFISPSIETLEMRLIERWLIQGLNQSAAKKRAEENDLVNARLVFAQRSETRADIELT